MRHYLFWSHYHHNEAYTAARDWSVLVNLVEWMNFLPFIDNVTLID